MAPRIWQLFKAAKQSHNTAMSAPQTAAQRVLQTYELLEQVLLHLPSPSDVRAVSRVNHLWHAVIQQNQALKKKRLKRKHLFVRELNLCLVGTSDSGQRDLPERWTTYPHVLTWYDPTLEDTWRKTVTIDGEPYFVTMHGPVSIHAGHDTLAEHMVYTSNAYVLVCSMKSRPSFHGVVEWQRRIDNPTESDRERLRGHLRPAQGADLVLKSHLVGVIATHCEVEAGAIQVPEAEGVELAQRLDCPFFEVSTRTDCNIMESLSGLVQCWLAKEAAQWAREWKARQAQSLESTTVSSKCQKRWWRRRLC